MTKRKSLVVAAVLITAILAIVPAMAQGHVKARIGGYQEVPPISSQGHGSFTASIDHSQSIFRHI